MSQTTGHAGREGRGAHERSALELGGHNSYVNAATLWLLIGGTREHEDGEESDARLEEMADLGGPAFGVAPR